MDFQSFYILIAAIFLLDKCDAIRVRPCPTNKIAPRVKPNGKTFNLLFGPRPIGDNPSDCGPVTNPDDDPALATIDGVNGQQGGDYDPVNSEEEDGDYLSVTPPRPQRPNNNDNNGNFLNWLPGLITPDRWPTRPPRPPPPPSAPNPNWFWGWFGGGRPTRPPRPPRPQKPQRPPYEEVIKPVYEHIEDDYQSTTWKPGPIVGGPSNDIIGVTQDLSNWNTEPPPRPTRPYIPGYTDNNNNGNSNQQRGSQTIIGSFIDLLFNRK